jgi:hypothetical protein
MNVTTKLSAKEYAVKLVTLYGDANGVSLAKHYLSFWEEREAGYRYWKDVIENIESGVCDHLYS